VPRCTSRAAAEFGYASVVVKVEPVSEYRRTNGESEYPTTKELSENAAMLCAAAVVVVKDGSN
jgi:hypothetical protein